MSCHVILLSLIINKRTAKVSTLKTRAGARPPPSDKTVSLNRLPVSAMADSSSKPASSKALKASADSTSAHL